MTRCDERDGARLRLSLGDKLALIAPALAIVAGLIGLYSRLAIVETRVEQLTLEISLLRLERQPRLAVKP